MAGRSAWVVARRVHCVQGDARHRAIDRLILGTVDHFGIRLPLVACVNETEGMVMGKWMSMVKYSPETAAELASGAAAFRDARVGMLEGAGFTVHDWWVSADPEWDAVFIVETDDDWGKSAKFQMTVKGSGSLVTGKLVAIVDAEDVDAAG